MKSPRNLFASVAVVSAVALGGCASTGGTTTADVTAVIAQIQQSAVTACGFLPTVSTVTNILGTVAGVGAETQLATTIAAQICAAVSPAASARRGGAAPTVTNNGKSIVVHGRFVN